MNKQIADLILAWHTIYVSLNACIEDARVVIDQSDRGVLLPDRVREMRGKMLGTLETIPQLADLLEELTGETTWPMKVENESPVVDPIVGEPDAKAAAEAPTESEILTPVSDEASTPADEATPTEDAPVDEEAAAEGVDTEPDEPGGMGTEID